MMDKLTVLETLEFATDLKLSQKVVKSVKQKIVRINIRVRVRRF